LLALKAVDGVLDGHVSSNDDDYIERARRIVGEYAPGEHGLTNRLVQEFEDVAAAVRASDRNP
jgi:hypothetical protein